MYVANTTLAHAVSTPTDMGSAVVDKFDGAGVILTKRRWASGWEAQIGEHTAQSLGNLGSGDSSNEFGLGGAGGSDALGLAAVGDGSTSIKESIASGGAAVAEVVSVSSVNEAMQAVMGKGRVGAEVHGVGGAGSGWISREFVSM